MSGEGTGPPKDLPKLRWVSADDNPWGVPVLDVRPVTRSSIAVSSDIHCARNAVSYGGDDGKGFIGQTPDCHRTVDVNLAYGKDRVLLDGALFVPQAMEDKWALFLHQGNILCIRSWQRKVLATARVTMTDDKISVRTITGAFATEDEPPEFTAHTLDYLLRTLVMKMPFPCLVPRALEGKEDTAAEWCFHVFGSQAHFATFEPFEPRPPYRPLRSHSLLHIAVARGDTEAIEAYVKDGVPLDLLGADGLTPLHWALASSMVAFLLDLGAPVDAPSTEGTTPLMSAVQARDLGHCTLLLDRGADPNGTDNRGFTALHRAAEMGELAIARLLLDCGARPDVEAQGHTPLSLADHRGEREMVALLSKAQG